MEKRRTAIYVRISTAMQKTGRQVEELVAFAKSNRLNFDESTDIYKDIISGFKDGEDRPNFSILMAKFEMYERINPHVHTQTGMTLRPDSAFYTGRCPQPRGSRPCRICLRQIHGLRRTADAVLLHLRHLLRK
ncbi:MAG: recombinase family protein [Bacteroidales bacterium]|nr:recombinase family protein [Candidatus Cacconaster scatequi]